MGKITVKLTDETESKLRKYVTTNFPEKPYGKLSLIVEEALKKWLNNENH